MKFRIRRSSSVGQPELRAAIDALDLATRAKSPAKRARALSALEAARDGLRASAQDPWHREGQNDGQWSDARGRELMHRIRAATRAIENEQRSAAALTPIGEHR